MTDLRKLEFEQLTGEPETGKWYTVLTPSRGEKNYGI